MIVLQEPPDEENAQYIAFYGIANPNSYLSNFFNLKMEYLGTTMTFGSEQCYQSAKIWVGNGILSKPQCKAWGKSWEVGMTRIKAVWQAKKLGADYMVNLIAAIPTYRGWTILRYYVMIAVLVKKFSNPALAERLKRTGTKLLLEANPHDDYWGTSRGRKSLARNLRYPGSNWCGVAIMAVRELMFGDKPDKFVTYELTTGTSRRYISDFSDPLNIKFYSPKTPLSFKLRAAVVIAHRWVSGIKLVFCTSDFVTLTDIRPYTILETDSSDEEVQQASLDELETLSISNPDIRITIVRLPLSSAESHGDLGVMQLTAKIWDTFFDILEHKLSSRDNIIWEGNFQKAHPGKNGKGDDRTEPSPEQSPYGAQSTCVDTVARNRDGEDMNPTGSSVTPSPDPLVATGEEGVRNGRDVRRKLGLARIKGCCSIWMPCLDVPLRERKPYVFSLKIQNFLL